MDKYKACRDFYKAVKQDSACYFCNDGSYQKLTFHHRHPEQKIATVSSLSYKGNLKRLWNEMEKCDILCVPCHERLHRDWDRAVSGPDPLTIDLKQLRRNIKYECEK